MFVHCVNLGGRTRLEKPKNDPDRFFCALGDLVLDVEHGKQQGHSDAVVVVLGEV